MTARQRWAACCACLVLALLGVVLFAWPRSGPASDPASGPRSEQGAGRPGANAAAALVASTEGEHDPLDGSTRTQHVPGSIESPRTATLTVQLVDDQDTPVPGRVHVATGAAARALPRFEPGSPLHVLLPPGGDPGAVHPAPGGTVEIPIQIGEPIWLRAAPEATPACAEYRLLDPLDVDREVRFVFDPVRDRCVHVLVHAPSLDGPAVMCEVEVRRHGETAPLWRGHTDVRGYVAAAAPATGVIEIAVACAPAADRDARAVVDLAREQGDRIVVLAAPEPEVPCTFTIEFGGSIRAGRPLPAVLVCRVDGADTACAS